MMKRSIVMTSDPFAMPVRGKSDRTVPIGPENRDAVSRQPLEDLGGRVPVVVVPTDADHGLARRELVQPLVRRRGPRPDDRPSRGRRAPPSRPASLPPAAPRRPGTGAAPRRTAPAAPRRGRSHRAAAGARASRGSVPREPHCPPRPGLPPAPRATARPMPRHPRETRDRGAVPTAPPARARAPEGTPRRPPAAIDHDPAAVGRPEGRGVPLPYIEKMYR